MKICIVKLSAMGDIIHAMVALQFIKKALPTVRIDWVVEEAFKGVLENNPDIDNVLCVNLKSLKKKKSALFSQYRLLKSYAKNNYDVIIDAQGLLKSALVAKIIGAKEIVGFDKASIREGIASLFYTKRVSIAYTANTIDRNVRVLCEPLGIEVSPQEIINKKPFLVSKCVVEALPERFLLLVIGSTWESRNYPKEKFVAVVEALGMKALVVWGSEEEHRKALWMQKQSAFIEVLPKGSLDALKYVISRCALLIGNDTGPTHMAWALNVPSITLFGPTPINRVYVTPINKVVKSKSSVNPLKLNKQDFSIREIEAEEIVKVAKALLLS